MQTITEILAQNPTALVAADALPLAYRGAVDIACQQLDTANRDPEFLAGLLSDKGTLALRREIAERINRGEWLVASPEAFSELCINFKSKDKVDAKRRVLLAWLVNEKRAFEAAIAKAVAAQRESTAKLDERIANGEAGVENPPVKAKRAKRQQIAVVHEGTPPDDVVAAKPSAVAKPTPARDKYDGMTLVQLLAEVERMFPGTETKMTSESALRYKLRRGERQIAAGEKPRFSVSTPSSGAAAVKLQLDTAEVLLRLVQHYASMHAVGELDAAVIAQLGDKVAAAKSTTQTT